MKKADDRRSALLDALADHMLANGISTASLRPMAAAAGISDRMLLYYFRDKADVIAATLERVAQRMVVLLDARGAPARQPIDVLRAELYAVVSADEMWPFMRVWLEIAALSARGDPLFRAVGEQIGRGFLDWGKAQLDSPDAESLDRDAARLFVSIEGMVLLRSLGLDDVSKRAL